MMKNINLLSSTGIVIDRNKPQEGKFDGVEYVNPMFRVNKGIPSVYDRNVEIVKRDSKHKQGIQEVKQPDPLPIRLDEELGRLRRRFGGSISKMRDFIVENYTYENSLSMLSKLEGSRGSQRPVEVIAKDLVKNTADKVKKGLLVVLKYADDGEEDGIVMRLCGKEIDAILSALQKRDLDLGVLRVGSKLLNNVLERVYDEKFLQAFIDRDGVQDAVAEGQGMYSNLFHSKFADKVKTWKGSQESCDAVILSGLKNIQYILGRVKQELDKRRTVVAKVGKKIEKCSHIDKAIFMRDTQLKRIERKVKGIREDEEDLESLMVLDDCYADLLGNLKWTVEEFVDILKDNGYEEVGKDIQEVLEMIDFDEEFTGREYFSNERVKRVILKHGYDGVRGISGGKEVEIKF